MKKGLVLFFILLFVALGFSPADAARDKDTIVIVQGVDPTKLDPHDHMETPAWNVLLNLFDSLLQRDPNIKMEKVIAESYRIVNDKTWEFKIRKGVKFHNGEDCNAASFKFSLERMADPRINLDKPSSRGSSKRWK